MRKQKKKRLAAKGWKVGSIKEFLGLSDEESAYIEAEDPACSGIATATAGKRIVATRSRGKTSVEPIAGRENGSGRSFRFLGPPDPLSPQSWGVGTRIISDYYDSPSRIARVLRKGRKSFLD